MAVTATTDYIDKFELKINEFNEDKLTAYIERYEEIYLTHLMGKELYDLYVIGIAGSDPIYEFLRDPFTVQLSDGCIYNSRGVKDMLLGVVYFYYSRDIYTTQTFSGAVKPTGENSNASSFAMSNLKGRYNESIETFKAIQAYITDNITTYPKFKGIEKGYTLFI